MNSISHLICIWNHIPFWKQRDSAYMPFASPNKLLIAAGIPVGFQPLILSFDFREIPLLEKSPLLLKWPKIEFYFALMWFLFCLTLRKTYFGLPFKAVTFKASRNLVQSPRMIIPTHIFALGYSSFFLSYSI